MTDIAEIARERDERLQLIRNSAASLVPRDGGLARVRQQRFAEQAVDRATWAQVCSMGWPGLCLAEELGGSGLGMAEYVALLEELGQGLLPEPLIEAGLVAPLLPAEEREALLSGELLVLPAGIMFESKEVPPSLSGGRLTGAVRHVVLGGAADAWLVACDSGLALVHRSAEGVEVVEEPTQDGGHLAHLRFRGSPACQIDAPRAALDTAALGCAAYLVGLMDAAFERTREYLNVRRQFGRPIGAFQALQHRMVDLKIQVELARAMVSEAARVVDAQGSPGDCARLISTAKVKAAEAAMLVTRQAIQLHGGIGYTDEADIGLFLRRAMVLLNAHGSVSFHKRRYFRLLESEGAL